MTSDGKAEKILAGCIKYQAKTKSKEILVFNFSHSFWKHENETEKMAILLRLLHL